MGLLFFGGILNRIGFAGSCSNFLGEPLFQIVTGISSYAFSHLFCVRIAVFRGNFALIIGNYLGAFFDLFLNILIHGQIMQRYVVSHLFLELFQIAKSFFYHFHDFLFTYICHF